MLSFLTWKFKIHELVFQVLDMLTRSICLLSNPKSAPKIKERRQAILAEGQSYGLDIELENALVFLYLIGNQNDEEHGDFDF